MPLARIEDAIEEIRNGRMVIVVDDEDRENEGDLIFAAEKATAEMVTFMVRHCSGIICVPLESDRLDDLNLPLMAPNHTDALGTAFTISIDVAKGTTTGISAADRARSIDALIDPATRPADLARPGHIFPLRYTPGGVLRRAGHTEASVDLARLAGLYPGGVLCEIVNEDGTMSRMPDLEVFAEEHGLLIISIADLIRYRRITEQLVTRQTKARIPTAFGEFTTVAYESDDGRTHVALVKGDVAGKDNVLVRVHSECFTGDVLGSVRCDCGMQLHEAMRRIDEVGEGVVVYIRGHEGRGIGLKAQARGLCAPGRGFGHRRGKHRAWLRARLPGLRRGGPDPRGPRGLDDASAHKQPDETCGAGGLRPEDRGARPRSRVSRPTRTFGISRRRERSSVIFSRP